MVKTQTFLKANDCKLHTNILVKLGGSDFGRDKLNSRMSIISRRSVEINACKLEV